MARTIIFVLMILEVMLIHQRQYQHRWQWTLEYQLEGHGQGGKLGGLPEYYQGIWDFRARRLRLVGWQVTYSAMMAPPS